MEAAHFIKTAFKSLAASAQTWLTTKPDSNAQVIASFFIVIP
jgi:hypothetical protein